jgi:methyl-accepting chemotaxis protein
MFNTIKAKLVLFSLVSIALIAVSVSISYVIALANIKDIMKSDVASVADALEKNINYIASIKPDAYKEPGFKRVVCSVKVGKSGYPFMLDTEGTLTVHPTDEGKSLAGLPHIDYIRNHKEGGVYEYTASTTKQVKIVAFRYIKAWDMWIVPGVNEADYFDKLIHGFLKWNLILGLAIIATLVLVSTWISRTITNPLQGMLRIFRDMDSGSNAANSAATDSKETRQLICQLLENLLSRKR